DTPTQSSYCSSTAHSSMRRIRVLVEPRWDGRYTPGELPRRGRTPSVDPTTRWLSCWSGQVQNWIRSGTRTMKSGDVLHRKCGPTRACWRPCAARCLARDSRLTNETCDAYAVFSRMKPGGSGQMHANDIRRSKKTSTDWKIGRCSFCGLWD